MTLRSESENEPTQGIGCDGFPFARLQELRRRELNFRSLNCRSHVRIWSR